MRKKNAFTLIEILIAVTIIGILSSMSFYFYKQAVDKARANEAIVNVKTISDAEKIKNAEIDRYLAADNIEEINRQLELQIKPKYYEYRVAGVTDDNFIVIAKRIGEDIETSKLPSELLVIAMNKAGVMQTGYQQYLGESSGAGTGGTDIITGSGAEGLPGGDGVNSDIDSGEVSGGGDGGGSSGSSDGGSGGGSGSGGSGSGGSSGGSSSATTTRPSYFSEIQEAVDLLKNSRFGQGSYNIIEGFSISTIYDDFSKYEGVEDALAFWWGIEHNTIYVNQKLKTMSPVPAIAAIIAHEVVHAEYDYFPEWSINDTLDLHPELTESDLHITVYPGNSIDQEFYAFARAMTVWKELKGSYTDYNLDAWEEAYDQGVDFMKAEIRKSYPELPEY